jgi:hypothetical protein
VVLRDEVARALALVARLPRLHPVLQLQVGRIVALELPGDWQRTRVGELQGVDGLNGLVRATKTSVYRKNEHQKDLNNEALHSRVCNINDRKECSERIAL